MTNNNCNEQNTSNCCNHISCSSNGNECNSSCYGAGIPQPFKNCSGKPTISGTDADDFLIDLNGNDNIHGHDGNDQIFVIFTGNDKVRGGSGNDVIFVNGGDTVCAGDGNDNIDAANREIDKITCSDGNDFAFVDEFDIIVDPDDCETLIVVPFP